MQRFYGIGGEFSGKDAVLIDIGRTGPVQADISPKLDLTGGSVVFDGLAAVSQLHIAPVVHIEGLVAVLEAIDAVDSFDSYRSGSCLDGKRE